MEKIISFIFLVLISLSLISQSYSGEEIKILKKHGNYFSKNLFNDLGDNLVWNCSFYSEDTCFESFTLNSYRKDTSLSISFLYYHLADKNLIRYKLLEYSIGYYLNDSVFFISKDENNDTLMAYSHPKDNKKQKTFIVGKYAYLLENMELTPKQLNYYLKYRDSLMYVRGNDLPPLPEIDLVEDDYTMNLYIIQGKDFYYPKLHDKIIDYCDEDNW